MIERLSTEEFVVIEKENWLTREINKEERDLSSLGEHEGSHGDRDLSQILQHLRRFYPILSLSRGSFLPLATHLNFGVLSVSLLSLHRDFD